MGYEKDVCAKLIHALFRATFMSHARSMLLPLCHSQVQAFHKYLARFEVIHQQCRCRGRILCNSHANGGFSVLSHIQKLQQTLLLAGTPLQICMRKVYNEQHTSGSTLVVSLGHLIASTFRSANGILIENFFRKTFWMSQFYMRNESKSQVCKSVRDSWQPL